MDFILSFVEVAVHNVLFTRKVYPEAIFERRKEYGIAVWMSRYPHLNACINEALSNMRAPLLRGAVEAIVLLLFDTATGTPLEQFVFRVGGPDSELVPATYSDLETMFASALLRIGMLEMQLPPLPAPGPPGAPSSFMSAAALDGSGIGPYSSAAAGASSAGSGSSNGSYVGGTSFTLLMRTHETLVGPNDGSSSTIDSGDQEGGAASSSSYAAGVLGTSGSGNSNNSYWLRVDPGDAEAELTVRGGSHNSASASASAIPSVVSMPIKSIRAGELALDVVLDYSTQRYGLPAT